MTKKAIKRTAIFSSHMWNIGVMYFVVLHVCRNIDEVSLIFIINISISVNIQDIPISSVTPHLQNHEQHNLCDIYNEAPLLFI